jgi:hypothetical protein
VHACAFLKPEGRLAMVLPAELLTVHYAEPVRRFLRRRFAGVTLVLFDRLQFEDALEKVVLVLAHGNGGCDSFTLLYVNDAEELAASHIGDSFGAQPANEGKWTDLLLPLRLRQLYRRVVDLGFAPLAEFGKPELGTVTGSNDFFAISEATRLEYEIREDDVVPICPPGSRHLKGPLFSKRRWQALRDAGERVWLLMPSSDDIAPGLQLYIERGMALGVNTGYKCQIRNPWWRPPCVPPPDLFFTYMSHRYPRLVNNVAGVAFLNSMHGVQLRAGVPRLVRSALPLLTLNSVTMLGAEIHGRSYGGGILKMEPREAALLPVPDTTVLIRAWESLKPEREHLERQLVDGLWTNVAKRVDEILLQRCLGLSGTEAADLHSAAAILRERRMGS